MTKTYLKGSNKMADVYFWRQSFIALTKILYSISTGFMISFPSVLSFALLTPNTTDIQATSSQASWIAASNGIAGIFGFLTLPPIMQIYGRKVVNIVLNGLLFIGWIIFIKASNVTELLVARIIQGCSIGGIYINIMIISEYSDPKRRGYFILTKKSSVPAGILACHALSLIWDWRQLATFASVLPALAIVLTLFWPESPSYLAMKGRHKECEKSFVWLHGSANMQELQSLLSLQIQRASTKSDNDKFSYRFLFKKDFVQPFVIVSLLILLLDLCGKHYYTVYIIQTMIDIFGDKSMAIYCSMGVDLLTVIAILLSCLIINCYKRRTLLFSFGAATVVLMLIIPILIVLKISGAMWLTPALILLHSFVINIGIAPVCYTIMGEIIPLEYKGCANCLAGVVFTLLYTIMLKLTPVIMESNGIEGVYGIYSIIMAVCLFVLYFIVPETKDITLQEIENEFKGILSTDVTQDAL